MPYTWPFPLDDADALLALLGGLWDGTYADAAFVAATLHGKAQAQYQAHLDFLDLLAAVSRFSVPVFKTENWYPLVLLESARNAGAQPRWGDGGHTFGDGLTYGGPDAVDMAVWALPAGMVDADVILSSVTGAKTAYTRGLDFFVRGGAVWFRDDPFSAPGVRVEDVYADGVVTDRAAYLWAYRGRWDWDQVYTQFGYAVGLRLKSSPAYKAMVNAALDGLVEGTTVRCVEEFLAAACGVPLAGGSETVERVETDGRGLVVVTDAAAYRFPAGSTPVVAPGDAVEAGAPLTDALRFYEFNRGQVPPEVEVLALGPGLLAPGYFRELTFENAAVPLVVEEGVDGYTKVSFRVGGWPGDVEKFWADVHARGVAAGDTLAMRLDTREAKTGQPTAAALPATVNPLGFLLQNVFRGTLVVAVAKPAGFAADAPGLGAVRFLRRLLPPEVGFVLLVRLVAPPDSVTMDGPGSETAAGVEEDVAFYSAGTAADAVDPADYVTETARLTTVGGFCI